MSATKMTLTDQKFHYTSDDFKLKCIENEEDKHGLSKFDKELQERWNAAVDAGCFAYKLDNVEGRVVPGKYQVFVQLNDMRFNKRREPQAMNSISQPFNPEKFNFTKVKNKEVLFELCPKHCISADDHHLMIINNSPLEHGHSLLVPSVNSCLPQVLTEESVGLALETAMLSNHRGFHVGFNSLCAHASVNHLHFHTWYSMTPSCLETTEVSPICEDVFEVKNYPTTAFVFELVPETDVPLLAKKIHKVSSHLIQNEVAHNFHIIRGRRCRSKPQMNGTTHREECEPHSAIRVFLWPRNPVHGAKDLNSYESDRRPVAVYEFAGSFAVETRETYNSFTEEHFCMYLKRATLPEEEFTSLKGAIRELLNNESWNNH